MTTNNKYDYIYYNKLEFHLEAGLSPELLDKLETYQNYANMRYLELFSCFPTSKIQLRIPLNKDNNFAELIDAIMFVPYNKNICNIVGIPLVALEYLSEKSFKDSLDHELCHIRQLMLKQPARDGSTEFETLLLSIGNGSTNLSLPELKAVLSVENYHKASLREIMVPYYTYEINCMVCSCCDKTSIYSMAKALNEAPESEFSLSACCNSTMYSQRFQQGEINYLFEKYRILNTDTPLAHVVSGKG